MGAIRNIESARGAIPGPLTAREEEVLQLAIEKVVALGEEVGIGADQMILLLNAGLTVKELLELIVSRRFDVM